MVTYTDQAVTTTRCFMMGRTISAAPDFLPKTPHHLWNIFYNFSQRPRPSKHEGAIVEYLRELAQEAQCTFEIDGAQNCLIKKPGSPGRENEPSLLIQNHIDMVCDKLPQVDHDFHRDPIPLKLDGDWLTTEGTTLGADNGIGCAAALALLFEKDLSTPPLELIFTTDEETGLNGALNLEAKNITSKRMLNLDSEMWGELTVGCAGGKEATFKKNYQTSDNSSLTAIQIVLSGLRGGHSGVDIHMQQGNALKLMADFLTFCHPLPFSLNSFSGGRAHNIIPRSAEVTLFVDQENVKTFSNKLQEFVKEVQPSLFKEDQLEASFTEIDNKDLKVISLLSIDDSLEIIKIIRNSPHGAHKYDLDSPNKLVRLSSNLAELDLNQGKLELINSYRFMDNSDKFHFELSFQQLAQEFDLTYELSDGYPNWKPEYGGQLLAQVKKVYQDEFNIDPTITALHAGLECGIIKEKIEKVHPIEMDIVSFGPTIQAAHTPKERVNISSVEKFWNLLTKTLEVI